MPKPEKTRTLKTPAEKAIAALGVATRAVDKLAAKRKALMAELETNLTELDAAEKRRDYLAQNPDLPDNHTTPIPAVDDVVKPKRGRAVTDSPQA